MYLSTSSFYAVIGPRTIQHGHNYSVYLTYKGDNDTVQLKVCIENEHGEELAEKIFMLNYDTQEIVTFNAEWVSVFQLILFLKRFPNF